MGQPARSSKFSWLGWVLTILLPTLLAASLYRILEPFPRAMISGPFIPKEISSDGQMLYTVAANGKNSLHGGLQEWDVSTGTLKRTLFKNIPDGVSHPEFYHGKLIALWQWDNVPSPLAVLASRMFFHDEIRKKAWEFQLGKDEKIGEIHFSKDGRWLEMSSRYDVDGSRSAYLDLSTFGAKKWTEPAGQKFLMDPKLRVIEVKGTDRIEIRDLEKNSLIVRWEKCRGWDFSPQTERIVGFCEAGETSTEIRFLDTRKRVELVPAVAMNKSIIGWSRQTHLDGLRRGWRRHRSPHSGDGRYQVVFLRDQEGQKESWLIDLIQCNIRHIPGAKDVTFSPNCRDMVCLVQNRIELWDMDSMSPIWSIHEVQSLDGVQFSPDGEFVICPKWDGTGAGVRTRDGRLVAVIPRRMPILSNKYAICDVTAPEQNKESRLDWIFNLISLKKRDGWSYGIFELSSGSRLLTVQCGDTPMISPDERTLVVCHRGSRGVHQLLLYDLPTSKPWLYILLPALVLALVLGAWTVWRSRTVGGQRA